MSDDGREGETVERVERLEARVEELEAALAERERTVALLAASSDVDGLDATCPECERPVATRVGVHVGGGGSATSAGRSGTCAD